MKFILGQHLKRTIAFLILLGMILSFVPASATIFLNDGSELDDSGLKTMMEKPAALEGEPIVVFFYDPECSACSPTHDFIDEYLDEHPNTYMEFVNIANDSEQMEKFKEFKVAYNRDKVYIPVLYIGQVALEGREDIEKYFEAVYSWYLDI